MITGIVIVSHSEALAQGVLDLLRQMVGGRVPLAAAAGSGNPDEPIGTEPLRVLAAIQSVLGADGSTNGSATDVVVLMDLGSAIMSAEAALELLPPEQQPHVYLCEAPLVEGAFAAAARAQGGATVAQVIAEARAAAAAKAAQLAPILRIPLPAAPPAAASAAPAAAGAISATLSVHNALGLHMRPAARIVELAAQYNAEIVLACHGKSAPAHSLNRMATLGARRGDELTVTATGPDAAAALAALQALAAAHFGDAPDAEPPAVAAQPAAESPRGMIFGVPAAPGVAVGPAFLLRPGLPGGEQHAADPAADPVAEWERLAAAVAGAAASLARIEADTRARLGAGGTAASAIFAAHRLMLEDPDLLARARAAVEQDRLPAAAAWRRTVAAVAAEYEATGDPVIARRAVDVLDAGARVLRELGFGEDAPALPGPAILVAQDVPPSTVARLDANALGILIAEGGRNGHSAILARALGVPMVVGAGDALRGLRDGTPLALDGGSGRIWIAPDAALERELAARAAVEREARAAARSEAREPAVTRDGHRIAVFANISAPDEAAAAVALGAEGVGVFRTEILFMRRAAPPSEEEQVAAYCRTLAGLAGRLLVIRTLDVGGDKPLPYLPLPAEANPFLGRRGIRFTLAHPALLRAQVRAALRAGAANGIAPGQVALMFPMISTLDELLEAKAIFLEAQDDLARARIPFDPGVRVGIMIETPAAVTSAPQLAQHAAFFSIGTNDLAQYVMAADRGNRDVADLVDALHPPVLHAIRAAADAAHAAGIPVAVCGELAADPRAAALLFGLGVDELSMGAPAVAQVKAAIRRTDRAAALALADRALAAPSARAVAALLEGEEFQGFKV